jgi:tungstate transport system ATP-binding protein
MTKLANQTPLLRIENLRVNRGKGFQLSVDDFDLQEGEVTAIIGPNGAGKSTFLLTISKLIKPAAGTIYFKDQPISTIDDLKFRRQIALVLQEPLLLDTTVFNNIAVGLKYRRVEKSKQERLISDWLSLLNISQLKDRPASQLSGGQAQRVSLARALVLDPAILLLDEPFRALDAPSRTTLMQDLRRLLTETGTTTLYITHDQEQALFLGDKVAVLLEGRLRQVGSPQEVFSSPIDPQVAEFLGVENVLPGTVINSSNGRLIIDIEGNELEAIGGIDPNQNVLFCLRPEDITLWKTTELPESSARNQLIGHVKSISPQGPLFQVTLDCGFPFVVLITRASARELELKPGMRLSASFKASAVHLIPH